MTTSKLPEWPEKPPFFAHRDDATIYIVRERDAALARMEALGEVVREHHWAIVKDATTDTPAQAHERLDELLAACARKEAGR